MRHKLKIDTVGTVYKIRGLGDRYLSKQFKILKGD